MNIKQIIKENNNLQKQLNDPNKQYYENLLVYIRSTNFKQERAKEEVLLEMGQHILEAQTNNQTAMQVFSKSPKQLADEIIENLPNETKKEIVLFGMEMMAFLFGIYVTVSGLLPLWEQEVQEISTGKALVVAGALLLMFVVVMVNLFVVLKKEAFSENKWKLAVKHALVYGGCLAIFIIVLVFIPSFGPTVALPYYMPVIIGVLLLGASFALKKLRQK